MVKVELASGLFIIADHKHIGPFLTTISNGYWQQQWSSWETETAMECQLEIVHSPSVALAITRWFHPYKFLTLTASPFNQDVSVCWACEIMNSLVASWSNDGYNLVDDAGMLVNDGKHDVWCPSIQISLSFCQIIQHLFGIALLVVFAGAVGSRSGYPVLWNGEGVGATMSGVTLNG